MRRLVDIVLFLVLATLSFWFGYVMLPRSRQDAEGIVMFAVITAIITLPPAIAAVITGVVRYRLLRDRLFWALGLLLFGIIGTGLYAGSWTVYRATMHTGLVPPPPPDVRSTAIEAAVFTPLPAISLWQTITAVRKVIERWRSRA